MKFGFTCKAMALLVACLIALMGCGARTSSTPDSAAVGSPSLTGGATDLPFGVVPAGYDGRFRGTVTVLESPGHGPQLCAAVAETYPPQCEGPDIEGWRWDELRAESARGTTWGDYTVTGHFADDVFTLTGPAQPTESWPPPEPWPPPEDSAASPCVEPAGGWVPAHPEAATSAANDETVRVARQTGGYGGVWIGWLIPEHQITEANSVDPANYVLNFATTDDVAALEQKLREVWAGNLCVVSTERTEAELNRIVNQFMHLPGVFSASADIIEGTVEGRAWVVTEYLWRQAAQRFGADVVRLDGILQPIDRRLEHLLGQHHGSGQK